MLRFKANDWNSITLTFLKVTKSNHDLQNEIFALYGKFKIVLWNSLENGFEQPTSFGHEVQ